MPHLTGPSSARTQLDLEGVPKDVIDAYHLDRLPLQRPVTSTAELLRLDGKVALVTGGGGQGLGNAICQRLAEQGARIAILDVNAESGHAAADDLARTWGAEACAFAANVADWDSTHDAVSAVAAQFGTIDILINNAGGSGAIGTSGNKVGGRTSTFSMMDRADMEITVGVNLFGVLHVTRAVLDVMLPRRSGRIINISSEGGKVGGPSLAVYSSCKAAIIALTRNLAHDLGPEGVSIVAVCPSIMVSERLLKGGLLTAKIDDTPLGASFRRTTIGRISMADEVASMVAFLASEAGSYVHGTAVSVGGGFSD
ncbi:MAG: SDR family NAD(P)-dependent oxidoreductase [Ilumatobacteraceae bacterium]